jgi:hypothetical protein
VLRTWASFPSEFFPCVRSLRPPLPAFAVLSCYSWAPLGTVTPLGEAIPSRSSRRLLSSAHMCLSVIISTVGLVTGLSFHSGNLRMTIQVFRALLPELQSHYLFDDEMVHHKLVVGRVYNAADAERINRAYLAKKAELTKLNSDIGDGYKYVFLHERPYRFDALVRIAKRLSSSDYWKLVSGVWTDSENIRQRFAAWKRLWTAPVPDKDQCMDAAERTQLEQIPLTFDVWRGIGFRGRAGLSWTIDRDIAVRFAYRFSATHARLLHGHVRREDVHAFFIGRKESEIVASEVKVFKVEKLPAPLSEAQRTKKRVGAITASTG